MGHGSIVLNRVPRHGSRISPMIPHPSDMRSALLLPRFYTQRLMLVFWRSYEPRNTDSPGWCYSRILRSWSVCFNLPNVQISRSLILFKIFELRQPPWLGVVFLRYLGMKWLQLMLWPLCVDRLFSPLVGFPFNFAFLSGFFCTFFWCQKKKKILIFNKVINFFSIKRVKKPNWILHY